MLFMAWMRSSGLKYTNNPPRWIYLIMLEGSPYLPLVEAYWTKNQFTATIEL